MGNKEKKNLKKQPGVGGRYTTFTETNIRTACSLIKTKQAENKRETPLKNGKKKHVKLVYII